MRRNIFKLFLATLVFSVCFSSCSDDDDYDWVKVEFDYSMSPIPRNGDFKVSNTMYLDDINKISGIYGEIHDINARNSWVQVETDDEYGFTRGDEIYIDRIVVNGESVVLEYVINVTTSLEGSTYIAVENDPAYRDFMYRAMKLLNDRGRISIDVYGYSSLMYDSNLYVVLANNLEVLVDNYR